MALGGDAPEGACVERGQGKSSAGWPAVCWAGNLLGQQPPGPALPGGEHSRPWRVVLEAPFLCCMPFVHAQAPSRAAAGRSYGHHFSDSDAGSDAGARDPRRKARPWERYPSPSCGFERTQKGCFGMLSGFWGNLGLYQGSVDEASLATSGRKPPQTVLNKMGNDSIKNIQIPGERYLDSMSPRLSSMASETHLLKLGHHEPKLPDASSAQFSNPSRTRACCERCQQSSQRNRIGPS